MESRRVKLSPVVIRSRLLCCPLQDLEQDIGCRVTPSHKVAEVVKVLRSDELQQLNLHIALPACHCSVLCYTGCLWKNHGPRKCQSVHIMFVYMQVHVCRHQKEDGSVCLDLYFE